VLLVYEALSYKQEDAADAMSGGAGVQGGASMQASSVERRQDPGIYTDMYINILYVCMYVYAYIYSYTHTHKHTHTHTHTYIYIYVYMHVCVYIACMLGALASL
jgi:hypothetical protein